MTFLQNLNWRYATKKFNGEKVGDLDLQKIKDATRLAPSSFGVQPYHVVVVENNLENKSIFEKLIKKANRNERKLEICSHLLVFCSRSDVRKRFQTLLQMQNRKDKTFEMVGILFQYISGIANFLLFKRWTTKNAWTKMQVYLALGFAISACAELKIDSSPMEGFDSMAYKKILNIPNNINPVVLLAIGYRDEADPALKFAKTRFSEEDIFTNI
jgi:nitroreductase